MTTAEIPKVEKRCLSVTVDPEVIEALDEIRGEVPRSRLAERALLQFLKRESRRNNKAHGEHNSK